MNRILSLFLFFVFVSLTAQEREGNIVEYFGKEKVEDVHEGEVLHIFTEALIYKEQQLPKDTEAVEYDPLFAKFIGKAKSGIKEGKSTGKNYRGEPIRWEEVQVNENSEFQDPGLRDGYLYLEYDADAEEIVLLDASGHTSVLVNGFPHEGDYYDFGWNLIPLKLKKGKNEFILSSGRFSRMRARLIKPKKELQFTQRDMTLPEILIQQKENFPAAIRIANTSEKNIENVKVVARVANAVAETAISALPALHVRKVPFEIPSANIPKGKKEVQVVLELVNANRKILDVHTLSLPVKSKYEHHKKTFVSNIDGSVQYYSMAPSLDTVSENQAMFFSLHGASVEAVNQANAYQQKDWGHIVAPTNRRPFGFAWEDWGRLDALEVLAHSENEWKTDATHTYLTGHSMGGHGTWYLGATYPDKFAAIAPAAGYPDLLLYRESFKRRITDNPQLLQERFKMGVEEFNKRTAVQLNSKKEEDLSAMIKRAGNTSRTLKLIENYLNFGIYVLHGEVDSVVPTFIARDMRERLGTFHNDFVYYEYPNGTHWYGNHSMDWPLIFDFFKAHDKKTDENQNDFSFKTASPGVSEKAHYIKILQQERPFEISNISVEKDSTLLQIFTENVKTIEVDFSEFSVKPDSIVIDKVRIAVNKELKSLVMKKMKSNWEVTKKPGYQEKGPHRYGGFKDAFKNKPVLVYATQGSDRENKWYYHRAKFDAEKFYYRANGDLTLVADTEFNPEDYPDQNIILYGNSVNHASWKSMLKDSPIQVSKGEMTVDGKTLKGKDLGAYFIYPRKDSDLASIGVITATGEQGMKAAWGNDYLLNGTFYPDFMIFKDTMMHEGLPGIKAAGFFDNSWRIEVDDVIWNE
ncbi:alpha/beta hydrolase-fold protein [Salegentibacter maritimus]|uniref:alpha/beta hydrolase-fold protein n=1 Tax=Salegentibacter maritimus TaxID=2794347 RepID=UPI0018E4344D|nr:alpha/beta hydrolase-fold protein [Salegentibacter maritimus]MBI6117576.1 alpha/beta hydrolase [Salegentibacter maritimus]